MEKNFHMSGKWICVSTFQELFDKYVSSQFPSKVLNIEKADIIATRGRDSRGRYERCQYRHDGVYIRQEVDIGWPTGITEHVGVDGREVHFETRSKDRDRHLSYCETEIVRLFGEHVRKTFPGLRGVDKSRIDWGKDAYFRPAEGEFNCKYSELGFDIAHHVSRERRVESVAVNGTVVFNADTGLGTWMP